MRKMLSGGLGAMWRWSPLHEAGWALWLGSIGLVASVLTVGTWHVPPAKAVVTELARLALQNHAAISSGGAQERAVEADSRTESGWTTLLPAHVGAQRVLLSVQQASQRLGVELVSVRVVETAAGADGLQRVEFAVQWTGRYEAIRQALGEILSRSSGMTVRHFAARRGSQGNGVEVNVTLTAWARAAQSSAPGVAN